MEDCWKPEEEISDDFAKRIATVLNELKHHEVLYSRDDGTMKVWSDSGDLLVSLTKHQALDKLLGIAEKVAGVLDEARNDVDKATLIDAMRSTLATDTPPDELDYGMIAVTKEDLESAARTMKLTHVETEALLRRREQVSWAVANKIVNYPRLKS